MQRSATLRIIIATALIFSFILVASPQLADAGGSYWHWVNPAPTGDTIRGVSMSPSGSTCLWVVGDHGLIQKTFDYGVSWHKFDPAGVSGTPTLYDIDLVADSVGWAVGENGTIVKISDGWNVSVQTAPAEAVGKTLYAVDALNATTAFAVGEQGLVIKTINGGATWVTVAANVAGLNDFRAVAALSTTQCLVAGIGNGGVSNNDVFFFDGSLFYNKSTADVEFSAEDLAFDPTSNTLWVVGKNKSTQAPLHYWVSSPDVDLPNSNALFYAPTPPMPTAAGYLTGISRLDATHTWVTTSQGELLFYNGSNPWVEQTHPYLGIELSDVSFRKTSGGQYEGAIVGAHGAMAATEDGAVTWNTRASFTNEWLPSVDFISRSTGYVVSGSDVLRTTDTGQSWATLGNTGSTSLLDVDFKDASRGCAVGRGGTAYIYSGSAWTAATAGMSPGRDLYSVSYVDANNIWACGDVGTIAKWNGSTWVMSSDTDVTSGLWRSIEFFDATRGIAVGDGGQVAYTSDGGANWSPGVSQVLENIYSVDMVGATTGYMVGGDAGVGPLLMRKTVDGGATWTQMTAPTGMSWKTLYGVAFADANTGWIVGPNGLILQTTNGGGAWTETPKLCDATLRAVAAIAPDAAWAVGDVGNMLSTYWPPPKAKIYRFYNKKNGSHFYTDSYEEKTYIIKNWPDVYTYEGVGYEYDATKATKNLWRFYNKTNGSHFYTASDEEKNMVLQKWPNVFTLDGPTYPVSPTQVPGSVPVYRFYNKTNGSHFYTASASERDMVLQKWPNVFSLDGEAFYLPQ